MVGHRVRLDARSFRKHSNPFGPEPPCLRDAQRTHGLELPPVTAQGSILLGTSAFTASGWEGAFYPAKVKPADYLSYYATQFDAVEVDSTFYRTPAISTVKGWYAKTPPGFLFAAKVPQSITHERVLRDCETELSQFLKAMDALGEKLGPLLFQFGYFNKKAFVGVNDFLARLVPFLKKLPKGYRFAVEIRNKNWLVPQFVEALRERQIALALVDHVWLPRPRQNSRMCAGLATAKASSKRQRPGTA